MTTLVFILILSFLVIIHELGHYWIARWRKIRVEEFGFGYPPRIKKLFHWQGTDFTLNAIPFGGFVKLQGEQAPADGKSQPAPRDFHTQSALSRLAVIVAGPVANIVFGIVAFSLVFSIMGIPRFLEERPRIESIAPGSPAEQAHLSAQDEIIGFRIEQDFTATPDTKSVIEFSENHRGETVSVVFLGPCENWECPTEEQEASIHLRTQEETPEGQGAMGVAFAHFFFEKGTWYQQLFNGIVYGTQEALGLGVLILASITDLVRDFIGGGAVSDTLAGPVGIVHQASQAGVFSRGWLPLLEFSGLLSINLGIMNLLPIPALDGGRILFILLEKIVGKKRIQNIEGYANYGGFVVLIGLIVLVSFRDILRLFQT